MCWRKELKNKILERKEETSREVKLKAAEIFLELQDYFSLIFHH